jgi:hypothetical protein
MDVVPRLVVTAVGAVLLLSEAACEDRTSTPPIGGGGLEWRDLAPTPSKRTEVATAVGGPFIYVMGGFADSEETVGTVEVYDTRTDVWETGPELPVPVNHPMAAGFQGEPYVFGGYTGPGLAAPSDRAFVLRGGRWLELPRMPETRAAGGAAAVDDRIYVSGGVGPGGLATTTMVFDPTAGQWSTLPGVPTPREHLGVAGGGQRLYVVGGRTSEGNLGTAEAFDTDTGRWTSLPEMPTPRGGLAAAATDNDFVVAVGGEAESTFDEAEAFDAERGAWRSLPVLPTARHGLGVAAVGNIVYVIAGGPTPGFDFSDANEALDLTRLRP